MNAAVNIDLITEARAFAAQHHRNHRCRHTGEPHTVHLEAVARLVQAVPSATPEMVAAAWLHDVVDEQEINPRDIREAFGDQVAGLVGELTDPANLEDGDRGRHAEINRLHTAMASREARVIKLADLADHARDILEHGRGDADIYDSPLWELAWSRVGLYFSNQGRELARA